MNFIQKLANYNLGNVTISELPDLAITAIEENFKSDNLFILAGMNETDNTFELEEFITKSLIELGITVVDKYSSAKILLRYYLDLMIKKPKHAFEVMSIIDRTIMNKVDWVKELDLDEIQIVGEELGLEKLYAWYRELQDLEDGDMVLYYINLPAKKQKKKFTKHLVEETAILKETLEIKSLNEVDNEKSLF